jgi:hypothetical protein
MFPGYPVVEHSGLNVGIRGISSPDGLLLRITEKAIVVDAVIESKMWVYNMPERGFEKQLENYRYASLVGDFFRNVLDENSHAKALAARKLGIPVKPLSINTDLKIIYAVPENSKIEFPKDSVEVEHVPVHSRIFAGFLDVLVNVAKEETGGVVIEEPEEVIKETEELIVDKEEPIEVAGPDTVSVDELFSERFPEGSVVFVNEKVAERVNMYYDLLKKAPRRIFLGQFASYFQDIGIYRLTKNDVNLAIAANLISPNFLKGNPRLTHEEAVILAYWLIDSNGDIARAHMDMIKDIAAEEWKKRQEKEDGNK